MFRVEKLFFLALEILSRIFGVKKLGVEMSLNPCSRNVKLPSETKDVNVVSVGNTAPLEASLDPSVSYLFSCLSWKANLCSIDVPIYSQFHSTILFSTFV